MRDFDNKPDISSVKTYDQVKLACEFVLKKNNKQDEGDVFSSAQMFEQVKSEFPNVFSDEFSKNTFYQYLSNTVKDAESAINCLGRKKGYYLSHVAEETKAELESSDSIDAESSLGSNEVLPQRRVQKENLLYPVLESWLVAQGYQARDVSAGRSLGKWGNPDVAGISSLDAFNGTSIEVVTIEAKVSLDNWEQWIFEAVSHRRFANRAYFAFAHPEETVAKIPKDMRYYAELFGIGVLVLSMDNEKYRQLQRGELSGAIDSEYIEVVEVFSAPYNFVQPRYQLRFCEANGVTCSKELYRWGRFQE